MDIGSTVGNLAFFTAFFAALSFIALSVELGENLPTKKEEKGNSFMLLPFFRSGQAVSKKPGAYARAKGMSAEQAAMDLEHTVASSEALTDGVALTELDEGAASIPSLRGRFIDGFLCPRIKYDVALTVLYESQHKKVDTPDEGGDLATQAFLEATQPIFFADE